MSATVLSKVRAALYAGITATTRPGTQPEAATFSGEEETSDIQTKTLAQRLQRLRVPTILLHLGQRFSFFAIFAFVRGR